MPGITRLEAGLIVLAVFLVLLVILWLVFRRARLWYWKTDIQIDTLKSIDARLHSMEERMSRTPARIVETAEGETLPEDGAEPPSELTEEREEPVRAGLTAVGKSGRIYTEAELELQIRE